MPSATIRCSDTPHNEVLSAINDEEYQRLAPNLRLVTLSCGQVLYEASEYQDSIYFPTTSVISLVYTTLGGASAEVGVIGNDGMLGVASLLGGETMPHRALAMIAGCAISARASTIQNEFSRGDRLQKVVLSYAQALLTQVSQTAVCNRLHSIEQRLCRWLLMCLDRAQSDDLTMTQEFMSQMLGGRRESVTVAAGHLQDAGMIQYARGHIRILDRLRLELASCECYRVVRNECNRLLAADRKLIDSFSIGHKSAKKCS